SGRSARSRVRTAAPGLAAPRSRSARATARRATALPRSTRGTCGSRSSAFRLRLQVAVYGLDEGRARPRPLFVVVARVVVERGFRVEHLFERHALREHVPDP